MPLYPDSHYSGIAIAAAERFRTFGLDWFATPADIEKPPYP